MFSIELYYCGPCDEPKPRSYSRIATDVLYHPQPEPDRDEVEDWKRRLHSNNS